MYACIFARINIQIYVYSACTYIFTIYYIYMPMNIHIHTVKSCIGAGLLANSKTAPGEEIGRVGRAPGGSPPGRKKNLKPKQTRALQQKVIVIYRLLNILIMANCG